MTRFIRQTVLVTGGSGGQGASHVRAFHAEGANVVIGDVDAVRGAALADELGDRARFVRLDVTDEKSWESAVSVAEESFGSLGVLVNNAGVQNPPVPIENTDASTWARILDINLTGTFLGIKAATPALRRAGGGAVVNIASTMGLGGTALYAPYVASKWAVRGLTRTAALELGRDRIRVNAIHPGVIATAFINEPAAGAAAPIADFFSPAPFAVPRLGEPADVTRLLLFLASADASFITGAEYVIDGGLQLGPALQHQ
ncbi:glucose 1-dehydrogenase [Kineosporia succinea]|uniref:3alpha(Or 20beta)-hydroxysteroid dehydrogenase n=1 Tax=Kineosporia succinea TaxID=84632 RepID=A0ABT9P9T2_9ACTN|nr:glucose 1-dehydrogenase [Kineosporia succinea]MDP9829306.1 3alpha(or 20beta)-hydroxysteroid dehydrogenase [Kineosporia succinea]